MTGTKLAWTVRAIGDLSGRTAVVTGANSGVGFETARILAEHRASVILACRDKAKGMEASQKIKRAWPGAEARYQALDLADLASVRRFAEEFLAEHDSIDILVNNAGVMGGPRRQTADGFEGHIGTNHLGHFALTGLLLPALLTRSGARVITVSSSVASRGEIDFADLQCEQRYRWLAAYAQSKLANLLFALELDRRARAARLRLASLASHPGAAGSNLLVGKEEDWGRRRRPSEVVLAMVQSVTGQPADKGALPSLYAATAPGLTGGEYVGPNGLTHLRGRPAQVSLPKRACDPGTARRLWDTSAELTGVTFDSLALA
jgi:NAD(P)-dependent dehydrogenase (short-subunit alcohol dehydrogenase family)